LNIDPKSKGEGSEGCFLPQGTLEPRAGCSEFSRLMQEAPGPKAVPFHAGTGDAERDHGPVVLPKG